jgi:hypothetical protein
LRASGWLLLTEARPAEGCAVMAVNRVAPTG